MYNLMTNMQYSTDASVSSKMDSVSDKTQQKWLKNTPRPDKTQQNG